MKFNQKVKDVNVTTNYMGGKAYRMEPAMELYTAVVTCMVDDSYYEKKADRLLRIKQLVAQNDPHFVAKLAVYARQKMNLRSVPIILAVELAKIHSGDDLVSDMVSKIVQRADEITELLSYYAVSNNRKGVKQLGKLSKQIQKGLAKAFNKFDEYQFAKYNRATAIKLRDALFVVHPKAKNAEQQVLFDKIAANTLQVPYTWETELSEFGKVTFGNESQRTAAKAALWEQLVKSEKVGYMAILRNLRNILNDGNIEAITAAATLIQDKSKVLKSKQLPFRFLSAYLELKNEVKPTNFLTAMWDSEQKKVQILLQAVETALKYSVENLPYLEGKTLILTDNSGSMRGDLGGKSLTSAMSKRTTADIANLFATMFQARCENTLIGLFGDRLIFPETSRYEGILKNFDNVNAAAKNCGLGTETGIFLMMDKLLKEKTVVDRIVIFSDCQVGTGCNWYDTGNRKGGDFGALFERYKREVNPNVITYSVDLKGYGNTLFKSNVFTVGGWSDKIFEMMDAIENGSSFVQEIMSGMSNG